MLTHQDLTSQFWELLYAKFNTPEPVFRTKKCVSQLNELSLFNCIKKYSFGGLGADTLTFWKLAPFLSISRIFYGGEGMGDIDIANKE